MLECPRCKSHNIICHVIIKFIPNEHGDFSDFSQELEREYEDILCTDCEFSNYEIEPFLDLKQEED